MAVLARLSGAHAILLASHLCASGQVAALPRLQAQFPGYLPLERVLRLLLTFLPESIEPQHYTPVLEELADTSSSLSALSEDDIDLSSVKDLSEAAARKRVRKLRLLPLKYRDDDDSDDTDLLAQFLIHRAHKIDAETSLQPFILDLLLPFYERSPVLRTWLISSLIPLLRLNYEYYPDQDGSFTLDVIESMDDQTAVNVLLSMTGSHSDNMDLVKNLRGLIGPWIHGSNRSKRRRLNKAAERESVTITQEPYRPRTASHAAWGPVNEWLLSRSLVDLESVVGAYTDWNGPQDVDLGCYGDVNEQYQGDELADLQARHGQSGLAVVYANSDTSRPTLDGCVQIVTRIAQQLGFEGSIFDSPLPTVTYDTNTISSTSRASLLQNALLVSSNPLTRPSATSISFLSANLSSLEILTELGHPVTCRAAANMCLHNSEDAQLLDLRSVIASTTRNTRSGHDWMKIRQQLLWLHNWQVEEAQTERSYHGLFWRVPRDVVETEILKALLEVKEYKLAVNIYTDLRTSLQASQVEAAVKDAITTAYDNASNGNRTRGGMKKAYDILQTFQSHFPDSVSFKQIQALISATHALSFYSLTLQHGVPFQPVSIRVHQDPLSLIEKVLDQNPKGYTNLDDLLSIGRNLVAAGFPPILPDSDSHEHTPISEEDAPVIAERRVISLAISSALASDDLGTAYSYIFTRLATPTSSSTSIKDDISWRAVYNAGRYRSPATSSSPNLQTQINQLSQRMELLSLALVLVPYPDPLPEILGAWRRCDEEMNVLRAQETEEEEIWDTKGDTVSMVPGGFGPSDSEQDALETKQQHARRARAYQQQQQQNRSHEEAPMGLFEVARGAAMALHKNTLPLRGMAAAGSSTSRPAGHKYENGDDDHEADSEARMRKRDVVSNMVTGGLASGIGWVLGAQPVSR
ncbi:hypothetical protein SI65_01416 [Aspergillus cristatus]|uniref:Sec39 domain-containing protein n=1 Tax=Aspergillus cristatus TaxID=573508 RepID=A0A1E3BSH6_ASPCR|nr:hypothetical protein SI65_01416 [Aspergillus cristatus]